MPETTAPVTEPSENTDEPELVDAEMVESDLLVEDVSIDGMCGVY
ncbi:MAG TPA: mycofactocin precursor MftA [Acidimicrobiales bacterium]